jgi:hypothetical protein
MGRAVTFSDLQPSKIISGVHNAAITQGETQEMAAVSGYRQDSNGSPRHFRRQTATYSWSTVHARFL